MSKSDLEELRAFRHRAEIEKIRDEVKASMVEHSPGSKHDKGCHFQAGCFDAKNQKKLVLAQTRVFAEQLSGHPLPVVKQLLQQMSPDSTVPRSRNKVVKLVMAELQNRED